MLERRLVLPLVFVVLGLAGAGVLVARTPQAYVATAQVFVTPSAVKDASGLFSGNQFALAKVQSYVDVVNSPDITREVRQELDLTLSDSALAGKITADAPLTQSLLNIHVTDASGGRAAQIANAVARQFVTYARSIDTVQTPTSDRGSATPVLKLTIVHPAVAPAAPVTPRTKLTLLVGLLAGLTLGVAALVLRERLDTRIRTAREVDRIAADVVKGVIPKAGTTNAFGPDGDPRQAAAYRLLRTNVLFGSGGLSTRSIAVVSPAGGEGRSIVAFNLACGLAELGSRVALLELDLSNPSLAARLDLDTDAPGVAALLAATAGPSDVVISTVAGVDLIPVGPLPADPHRLLRVERVSEVLADLAVDYDVVVIDAPPLLTSAGGVEAAAAAAATLIVARSGRTDVDELRRAVASVSRSGELAGVVLVGVLDRAWTREVRPTPDSSFLAAAKETPPENEKAPKKAPVSDELPSEEAATTATPIEAAPDDERAIDEMAVDEVAVDDASTDETASEDVSSEDVSSEDVSSEDVSSEDETPADETPADDVSSEDETPGEDETPADETPADETPAEDVSSEDGTPADEPPADEASHDAEPPKRAAAQNAPRNNQNKRRMVRMPGDRSPSRPK